MADMLARVAPLKTTARKRSNHMEMKMKKYADGGKHSDMAKDKPMMKKVAKAEVMAHEAKMHGKKMADGGFLKKPMMKMADGGACGHRSPQDYGKKK